MTLPAVRLPQYAVESAARQVDRIRPLVRLQSPLLTTACRQAGLPIDLAEVCGGLLASVADDLVTVGQLGRRDFERSKRMERILAATREPAIFALRIAMAASPTNGRACVRHWDAICDKGERGMFAWLLGLDTDNAYRYGKKVEKRQNNA
jgi:hypothetical protein